MTVAELISLLRQCDPASEVAWDYDGRRERPTAIERCADGVELLTASRGMLETLVEIGRDIVMPERKPR